MAITFTHVESPHTPGRKRVDYFFTDGTRTKTFMWIIDDAADAASFGDGKAAFAAAALVDEEVSSVIDRINNGENALTVVQGVQVGTVRATARRVLQFAFRLNDPAYLLKCGPLIDYLKATYTPAQLANFLSITAQRLNALDNRYQNAVALAPYLATDASLVGEL